MNYWEGFAVGLLSGWLSVTIVIVIAALKIYRKDHGK